MLLELYKSDTSPSVYYLFISCLFVFFNSALIYLEVEVLQYVYSLCGYLSSLVCNVQIVTRLDLTGKARSFAFVQSLC